MIDAILANLINIGWAMLIFLAAFLSNMAFSLYYNIQVLHIKFDWQKLAVGFLKVLSVAVGLTLLCTSITTLPLFADMVGWSIPVEYTDIFNNLIIIGAVLLVGCKYIAEAFTKFKAIIDSTGGVTNEQ